MYVSMYLCMYARTHTLAVRDTTLKFMAIKLTIISKNGLKHEKFLGPKNVTKIGTVQSNQR